MNKKQIKTLNEIFENPVRSNIKWDDIESLLVHLGSEVREGRGSRVRFSMNDEKIIVHRPHPHPDADKGLVKSIRRFLENAGVDYEL